MYNKLNENLYENKFLQMVLQNQPAFEKVINLKQQQRDAQEHKRQQEELALLNQVE